MNRNPIRGPIAAPATGCRSGIRPASSTWPTYLKASIACHAGAAVTAAALPQAWPWALGAVVANHAVLTGAGLWPRSNWLGRNWTRLPAASVGRREIAVTIDDGPEPDITPKVLDLLDAHGVRATFFAIGHQAAREPALCRQIVRRGHSVENHSDRHSPAFSLLGPRAMAREVAAAQRRLADITGVAPRYFRAPAGLRNPFLSSVLDRLGLELVSWTRRGFDTVRREPGRIVAALSRDLAAGDILLLHDGHAARTPEGRAVVLDVLPALLTRAAAAGLRPVTLTAAFAGAELDCDAAGRIASDAASAGRR
ncbi:MAG TPA: polysaccharide deacetylase family protein [Caldimonas sp.]|nr:polysaccharide deacetylase family protein [Caldimonas sp.]